TFNGAECSGPLPIDAVLWIVNTGENNHRPGFIEGYCKNIHKGKIRVGINIGNCAGYGKSNGSPGLPGRNGVNGHNGLAGRDGQDGAKGENCVVGPPGPGREKGEMGPSGTATDHRNWKQ
ncbi:unnamed protein product, partial [Porites lobata]